MTSCRYLRAILGSVGVLCLAISAASVPAYAAVGCTLTDVQVDAYDHGGVYAHGKLNGVPVVWVGLCGVTGGQPDCTTPATRNRLAVALSAQVSGKSVLLWFSNLNSCATFQSYMIADGVRLVD